MNSPFERPRIPNGRDAEPAFNLEDWASKGRARGTVASAVPPEPLPGDPGPTDPTGPRKGVKAGRARPATTPRDDLGGEFWANTVSEALEEFPADLVDGLVPLASVTFLWGKSNAGKTFAALDLAAAVSDRRAWLGREVRHGWCVYIAAEAPKSIRRRLKALRMAGAQLDNVLVIARQLNFAASDQDVRWLRDLIALETIKRGCGPVLIVGDTLARIAGGADENSAEMGPVIARSESLAVHTGAAFVWIAHPGKDESKGVRGWYGMHAAVDVSLHLTKEQGSNGPLHTVEDDKVRDEGEGKRLAFRLRQVVIGHKPNGNAVTSCVLESLANPPPKVNSVKKLSDIQAGVLQFLKDHAGVYHSPATIARALELPGREKAPAQSSVYAAIDALAERGLVVRSAKAVAWLPSNKRGPAESSNAL